MEVRAVAPIDPNRTTRATRDDRVAGVESSSPQQSIRLTDDSRRARDSHRQTEVDDLFAEWESDPLELLSLPGLGM